MRFSYSGYFKTTHLFFEKWAKIPILIDARTRNGDFLSVKCGKRGGFEKIWGTFRGWIWKKKTYSAFRWVNIRDIWNRFRERWNYLPLFHSGGSCPGTLYDKFWGTLIPKFFSYANVHHTCMLPSLIAVFCQTLCNCTSREERSIRKCCGVFTHR